MKERPNLVLNLENLNCEEARDSQYVLTSPRSLQACKIVQVKPIELLYRSVDEVRQQLKPSATLDQVLTVYQQQEKTRRSKLELCRTVRDQLVAFSDHSSATPSPVSSLLKENVNPALLHEDPVEEIKRAFSPVGVLKHSPVKRTPSPSVSFKRPASPKRITSPNSFRNRKELLDKENKAKAREGHGKALKAVENRLEDTKAKPVVVAASLKSPPRFDDQLPAVFNPNATSTVKKKTRTRKCVASRGNTRISVRSERLFPASLPALQVSRPSSSSYSTADSSSRPISGTSSSSTPSTKFSGAGRRLVSSATSVGRKSRTPRLCPRWGHTDTNNNSSSSKRAHSARQQLYGWLTDGMSVPEHDRRILESMAMKREEERSAEEMAHKAHLAWEMERLLREQEQWEQSTQRLRELAEKRRIENLQNERKMAELKEREVCSLQRLQHCLLEKEARSAALLRSASDRKGDRSEEIERQRSAVQWAREQLQQEGAHWRVSIQQGLEERLQRAEITRLKFRESTRRRVASANRVEELRHAERRRVLESEHEEALRLLRVRCQEKEERAQMVLKKASGERERFLKGQSEVRTSKLQGARQMHAELEAGLEAWRVQCATLQREASERAERRACQQQRERQQRAEAANRAREEHHLLIMNRVSAEQRAVEEARRSAILAKEDKMRRLQEKREQAVHESRAQAYTTAELRDQIRRTMSPETFDRLVARSALEARVTASRPATAASSPSCNRSHIFLG